MEHQLPVAVQLPRETPPELRQIHRGTQGLSRHYDPITTRQLAEAIDSLGPTKEEELFERASENLRYKAGEVIEDIQSGKLPPTNGFCIFGFDLDEDLVLAVKDEPDGTLLPNREYTPEEVNTAGLIKKINLSMVWAPTPNASIIFKSDGRLVDYNYHYVASLDHFHERNVDPMSITASELAIFLSQEASRKLVLMNNMYQNDPQSNELYQILFSEPLTRSLLIHRELHDDNDW